jgi:hypothetical protein
MELIEPIDGGYPIYYIINTIKGAKNTSYNNTEEFNEAVIIESIIYGKENIKSGEIEDLDFFKLVNELDVMGGESKANNTKNIL